MHRAWKSPPKFCFPKHGPEAHWPSDHVDETQACLQEPGRPLITD